MCCILGLGSYFSSMSPPVPLCKGWSIANSALFTLEYRGFLASYLVLTLPQTCKGLPLRGILRAAVTYLWLIPKRGPSFNCTALRVSTLLAILASPHFQPKWSFYGQIGTAIYHSRRHSGIHCSAPPSLQLWCGIYKTYGVTIISTILM